MSPAQAARAATGARIDGNAVPGKWHVYPELAPDGLWTTPTDLAKFAIEIARSAHGQANHVLSQRMTQEMLKVQCNDSNDRVGLGFGVGFPDNPELFRHTGGNDGFGSILMMLADSGDGLAPMGNSDAFASVVDWAIDTFVGSNHWRYKPFAHDLGDLLIVVQSLRGAQAALEAYAHVKGLGFAGWRHDSNTLNKFGYRLLGEKKLDEAIKVLALNVADYPQDANVYDSLGEAYMDARQKELAISNYEQSLKLNPANDNAVKKLATLHRPE
ncbi:MAG TPA: serine hydrolase [Pirellulales bacterium]|nr:serine hydrolase [Pirellulales bacterium]